MGWWQPPGKSYTIGDAPLDILDVAFDAVIREYEDAWERPPTSEEWQTLIEVGLGSDPPGAWNGGSVNPTVQIVVPGEPVPAEPPAFPELPVLGVSNLGRYTILGFDLDAYSSGTEPRLDLRLRNHRESLVLRFWNPRELELTGGAPPFRGLSVRDMTSAPRGSGLVGVLADDGQRRLAFVARALEILERTPKPPRDE